MLLDKGPLPGYFFISFVFFFTFLPCIFPPLYFAVLRMARGCSKSRGPGVGNDAVTDQGPFVGYLLAMYQ